MWAVPLAPELPHTLMPMVPEWFWTPQCTMTSGDSCQHLAMHPMRCNDAQRSGCCTLSYAFLRSTKAVISVHERGLRLEFGAVNEMAQGKGLVVSGHAELGTSLARAPEPTILRLADNALIVDGCIQTAEGLPNRYGQVVDKIGPVIFLERRGHKGGLHLL